MTIISENPRIVDLDGYVHLVLDQFICFKPGMLNLSDSGDRAFLIEYAEQLAAKSFRKDVACELVRHPDGGYCMFDYHFYELGPAVEAVIKEARHEFDI